AFEVIERDGIRYAEILRSDVSADRTTFFSPAASSLQFGLLAHEAGFVEPAHNHRAHSRHIADMQQMFVVQRGIVAVDFFLEMGEKFHEVILHRGDAILLVHGAHAIRVLEDMQCIGVKQGPFLGESEDKVFLPTHGATP
ncbi:MAG: hypothetical protein AAB853_02015, partial [Patescibacteria group bacterium]